MPADQEPAEQPTEEPTVQKDAFKAALERKRAQQHAHNNDAHGDSKVHGSSAKAGGKRTFRRKSGG